MHPQLAHAYRVLDRTSRSRSPYLARPTKAFDVAMQETARNNRPSQARFHRPGVEAVAFVIQRGPVPPTSLDGLIAQRDREICQLTDRIAHLREELQDLVVQRWALRRLPPRLKADA